MLFILNKKKIIVNLINKATTIKEMNKLKHRNNSINELNRKLF